MHELSGDPARTLSLRRALLRVGTITRRPLAVIQIVPCAGASCGRSWLAERRDRVSETDGPTHIG